MTRIVNRVPTLRRPRPEPGYRSYSDVAGWHFEVPPEGVDAIRRVHDQIQEAMAELDRKKLW